MTEIAATFTDVTEYAFVAPESIESARVCLRPVSETDLPGLLAILSDAEVVKHLGHAPWQSIADAEAWFARISKHQAAGSALEFVIVDKQTDQCIGRCGLFDFDATDAQASVGYILGRPHWRQGFMREALTSLIDCAFGQMGLRRLKAEAEAPNTASSSLLRRLGFTHEGVLRERWMDQSGPIDAELFALLKHEWRNTEASVPSESAARVIKEKSRLYDSHPMTTITTFADCGHRDQVIALWEAVFGYETAHNRPALVIDKKLAVEDELFFVAIIGDKIVGTSMAGYDGHRGWIYSVAVHPDHRKRGIGSQLVAHAERALTARGCMKINLQIVAGNEAVAAFYESLGYAVEPRVSMGKRIQPNIPSHDL